jgi:aflatoxin B1 aldehyde reductase
MFSNVYLARIYGEDMFRRGVSALGAIDPAAAAEVVVNTKASVRTFRDDTILTYAGVRNQLRLSLTALGRPRVNIFYLHQPDQRALLDDALRACDELHREGLFAELGLSNFPAWCAALPIFLYSDERKRSFLSMCFFARPAAAVAAAAYRQVVQIYYKCRAEGWVVPTVYQGRYNPLFRQPEDELIPALRKPQGSVFKSHKLHGYKRWLHCAAISRRLSAADR